MSDSEISLKNPFRFSGGGVGVRGLEAGFFSSYFLPLRSLFGQDLEKRLRRSRCVSFVNLHSPQPPPFDFFFSKILFQNLPVMRGLIKPPSEESKFSELNSNPPHTFIRSIEGVKSLMKIHIQFYYSTLVHLNILESNFFVSNSYAD